MKQLSNITQENLDHFKNLFSDNEKVQSVTLDDVFEYAKKINIEKQKPYPKYESAIPTKYEIETFSLDITPCRYATAIVVIDVIFVAWGATTIIKSGWAHSPAGKNAITKVAKAIESIESEIQGYERVFIDLESTKGQKAWAIIGILKLIYTGGMLEAVVKAIAGSLTWEQMVLYGIIGLATIAAAFLSDGALIIAELIEEAANLGFLVLDATEMKQQCSISIPASKLIPTSVNEGRYRIRNTLSGSQQLYLGVQINMIGENNGSLALEKLDPPTQDAFESSQVWYIYQYRMGEFVPEYVLINQQSGYIACIRGRSTSNDATAIQYYTQLTQNNGEFQRWRFNLLNDQYLLENIYSSKYIGPYFRKATVNNYIIQYSNQTSETTYQEWQLEPVLENFKTGDFPEGRYRIRNIASSNLYLGIKGPIIGANGASLALEMEDGFNGDNTYISSQVWYVCQFRSDEWILINQQTGYLACIQSPGTSNNATAIQSYPQLLESNGNRQRWQIEKTDGYYLLKNINSSLVLGPNNAEIKDNNYITQDKYLGDYQLWLFEPA